jgi:hypothetical protein
MKTIAIYSGSDWNDASVTYLSVPASFDLAKLFKEYREYLCNRKCEKCEPYKSFEEFLIEKGASTEVDLEEFWED